MKLLLVDTAQPDLLKHETAVQFRTCIFFFTVPLARPDEITSGTPCEAAAVVVSRECLVFPACMFGKRSKL